MSESLSCLIRSAEPGPREAGAAREESGTIDGFSYLVPYTKYIVTADGRHRHKSADRDPI